MHYTFLFIFSISGLFVQASSLNSRECNGHAFGGLSAELREPNSCTTHGFLLPQCSQIKEEPDEKNPRKGKTRGINSHSSR